MPKERDVKAEYLAVLKKLSLLNQTIIETYVAHEYTRGYNDGMEDERGEHETFNIEGDE